MNLDYLIKQGTFNRNYRKCTLKSSINPALAFAMNHLAELDEKDRLLDPCCGSATILIERQLLKPGYCFGIDIDPRALDCAKENIKEAGVEIALKHADIRNQKFPEGYFTKIISNLPYGIHSSSRNKNIELYRFLADVCEKWLKKNGKAVLLTSSKKLLWNSFADKKLMKFIEEIKIPSDPLDRSIFIFQKI